MPRMIDKARALYKNCLGNYIFPCTLDKIILEFLKIEAKEFVEHVNSDTVFDSWILNKCKTLTEDEKQYLNQKVLGKGPDTNEKRKNFIELKNQISSTREDVKTWVDLIDLEEGRL